MMQSRLTSYILSIFVLYCVCLLKCSYSLPDRNFNGRCQTPDGVDASCVHLRQCQPMLDLLQTLRPPFSAAVSKTLNSYSCGRQRVCCPPEPISLESHIIYHNREVPPDVTNHKNYNLLPEECGYLDTSIRIIHGTNAHLNEFPWMALLQYRTPHGVDFLCGGTIINPRYILTAAHCLGKKNAELISVRVGEYSIKNTTDCEVQNNVERTLKCNPPVQDLRVEEIISHPQFAVKTKNVLNDIALLRVSKISKAENVYPICLPVGELKDWPVVNAIVTGWGLIHSQTKERADILQKIGVPVTDRKTCAGTYSELGVELTKTQVCAGGIGGKSFCSGDSGGPMQFAAFREGNFVYAQEGIVSVAPRYCETPGYPGVYTGVKFYMDWILDNMKP